MVQQVIDIILRNAFLIIIIGGGLFNVLVRLAQKAREQRARRESLQETARQRQEALRTGRPIPSQHQEPQPDPQAERRERIETLRKERMEQLRALREKRTGTSSTSSAAPTSPSSISQNHPNMPPIPVHKPVQTQPKQPRHQAQPIPQARPAPRQTRRRPIVTTPQPTQTASALPDPRRVTQAPPTKIRKSEQLESLKDARVQRPTQTGHAPRPSARAGAQSARSMLRSRSSIRQAMILREILDTPIALRDQDIASGSLYT